MKYYKQEDACGNTFLVNKFAELQQMCLFNFNLLSANPANWSNTLKQFATANKLCECVWPICGVGR